MAKTLVTHKHAPGPFQNGHDSCHARAGHLGICPGVEIANWLNALGEDHEKYTAHYTNGDVRDNWLRGSTHIVALVPHTSQLKAEERRLQAALRVVRAKLQQTS